MLGGIRSKNWVFIRVGVWWRRALVLLLLLVCVGALVPWGLRGVGNWLVVEDPLDHARAIVVLSGHIPFRAMEAASIYRQGWAQEVWLTTTARSEEEAAMARLGLLVIRGEVANRDVLQRLGIPHEAIHVLPDGIRNTEEEVKLVARELERVGGDRVILVSSKPHTRRLRAIWRTLVGSSPHAIVRFAAQDQYDPSRWWRQTSDALAVSREVFGLLNVWAGFPLRPDRR